MLSSSLHHASRHISSALSHLNRFILVNLLTSRRERNALRVDDEIGGNRNSAGQRQHGHSEGNHCERSLSSVGVSGARNAGLQLYVSRQW